MKTMIGSALRALCVFAFAMATGSAAAAPLFSQDPVQAAAEHHLDEEHAHLYVESIYDRMSEAQLAALPKGKAHIAYNAPAKCVPGRLKAVLERVARKYGPITVNSTFRSVKRNRRAGGRKKSYHLKCAAVDFRVHARTRGLLGYLAKQPEVGGLKRYKTGFYHIDTGPRRTW